MPSPVESKREINRRLFRRHSSPGRAPRLLRQLRHSIVECFGTARLLLRRDRRIVALVGVGEDRDAIAWKEDRAFRQIIHGEGESLLLVPHRDECTVECIRVRVHRDLQVGQEICRREFVEPFDRTVESVELECWCWSFIPNQTHGARLHHGVGECLDTFQLRHRGVRYDPQFQRVAKRREVILELGKLELVELVDWIEPEADGRVFDGRVIGFRFGVCGAPIVIVPVAQLHPANLGAARFVDLG